MLVSFLTYTYNTEYHMSKKVVHNYILLHSDPEGDCMQITCVLNMENYEGHSKLFDCLSDYFASLLGEITIAEA